MNTNHPSFAKIAFVMMALTLIAAVLFIVSSAERTVQASAFQAAPNAPVMHMPASIPISTPIAGPIFLPVVLWSEPPTVTPTPLSSLPALVNGDFDQGPGVGWTETVNAVVTPLVYPCNSPQLSATVRAGCGGAYLAWLGGVGRATVDVLERSINLPTGYSSIGVKFRYYTGSIQGTCGVDSSRVEFAGVQQTFELCSSQVTNQWREGMVSVSGVSELVTLKFITTLASGALGSFYVDDVQLCSDDPKRPSGVLPCPTPLSPLPALVNGDFEQGPGVGWTETVNESTDQLIYPCTYSKLPQAVRSGCGGSYLAWLGGKNEIRLDVLDQTTTLPFGYSSIGVKYRYYVESNQTTCGVDSSWVEFAGVQQTFELCTSQATGQWRDGMVSAVSASGAVTLKFASDLAGGALSSFYVDDVQLCSDDPEAPASTLPCTVQVRQRSNPVLPASAPASKE